MKTFICCIFYTILLISFAGCGKTPPAELPLLIPCSVKIIDGSQPLVEVDVSLLREEGQSTWSLGGISDRSGTAKLRTITGSFEGNGIPAGTYSVMFKKQIDLPDKFILTEEDSLKFSPEELLSWNNKRQKYIKEHQVIPLELANPETTPIKLIVSEKNQILTVDVSKYR
jgi:hypothetical protein